MVATGSRAEKARERAAKWRAANPDKARANTAAWHAAHPDKVKAAKARYYEANREKDRTRCATYREANRDQVRARIAKWQAARPDKRNAITAQRRSAQLKRTPAWADRAAIAAVYAEAQRYAALGLDVHVDHYFPLQGKTVSGLHVHQNLRVVLKDDNLKKSNRHPDHV